MYRLFKFPLKNFLYFSLLILLISSQQALSATKSKLDLVELSTIEFNLKSTVPASPDTIALVRGYFISGDEGGGFFRWEQNADPFPPVDGGIIIGVYDDAGNLLGKWIREIDSAFVNVRWFGVQNDPSIDDSPAIQAAINYAASDTAFSTQVHFPRGDYFAHELLWHQFVNLTGEGVGQSRIFYNGPGGEKSTILFKQFGHAMETLEDLMLMGTKVARPNKDVPETNTPMADHLLIIGVEALAGKNAQVDNNASFRNLQFAFTNDDAIRIEGAWVNFHIDTIRFDAIGGYGIRMRTIPGQDTSPFSIRNFTMDNNIPTERLGAGLPWGKGLLRVDNGGHTASPGSFKFDSGRLEFNRPLIPVENGVVAAVYMEHAPGVGEEYSLEHSSVHITEFKEGGGSYIHSETRTRNVFTNMSFGTGKDSLLYSDNAHQGDIPANNYQFLRTFNTQPGLGRPGVYGNKGNETQTIFPNIAEKVIFNVPSAIKDFNSEWDHAESRWTCKVAGLYNISFQTGILGITPGKWVMGHIYFNGQRNAASATTSGSDTVATFVTVPQTLELNAGDTIEFYVQHNDAIERNIIPDFVYTKMSITRIP